MKKAKIIIPIVVLAVLTVLAVIFVFATKRDPSAVEISKEEAEEIAVNYFNEKYSVEATVVWTEYKLVSYKVYLNWITVLIDNEKYKLLLDDENKPLMDDYSISMFVKNLEANKLEEWKSKYGLDEYASSEIKWELLYSGYRKARRVVSFRIETQEIPKAEDADKFWNLLCELRENGFDCLEIWIVSPKFLMPNFDLGHGAHGSLLTWAAFSPDYSSKKFYKKYLSFTKWIYWDEDKFNEKIEELEKAGYKNPYFYSVHMFGNVPNGVTMVCYCETSGEADENEVRKIYEIIKDMDDTYIIIDGREIEYLVECSTIATENKEQKTILVWVPSFIKEAEH